MQPLVSIIIPTYNRAHLIGETLDSVIAQTYTNWECIVVDDGSTDNTQELLAIYCEKDSRIQYYHRPKNKPKGANACRNYGFEVSVGEFVNWFDDDDLMKPENLSTRLESFDRDTDFVIGDSIYFYEKGLEKKIKRDYSIPINPENFVSFKISWITNEVTLRRSIIKLKFNENLESDQDYNFFSRILYITQRGKYLKKNLTLRRMHFSSIQGRLKESNGENFEKIFINEYYLLLDIKNYNNDIIIRRILRRLIRLSYSLTNRFTFSKNQFSVLKSLYYYGNFRAFCYYFLWMVINLFAGKGYFLFKKVYNSLD